MSVEVCASDGSKGVAAVPSGASTGAREALELRDGDPKRYRGKGVIRAVAHANGELAAAVNGLALGGLDEQAALDRVLIEVDGTDTKSRLGANALLGVSLAAAHAEAGSFEEALRWQQKAVELAPPLQQSVYRRRLDLYRSRKPFRGEHIETGRSRRVTQFYT